MIVSAAITRTQKFLDWYNGDSEDYVMFHLRKMARITVHAILVPRQPPYCLDAGPHPLAPWRDPWLATHGCLSRTNACWTGNFTSHTPERLPNFLCGFDIQEVFRQGV